MPPRRQQLRVAFLLARDFTLTALSGFADVLRLAADDGDGSRPISCGWDIISLGREATRSSCGLFVSQGRAAQPPEAYDYVVVVGGLLVHQAPLAQEDEAWLLRAAQAGVTLVGVCTGSFILSRLGLMQGRACCVSWYHARDFAEEFPEVRPVVDQLFVVDRDRITCSGGAGVTDLAATLVEKHLGVAAAHKALNILLIDRQRAGSSAQPAPALDPDPGSDAPRDPLVDRALILMEQNLAEPLGIAAIARRLDVSTRVLERRFQSSIGLPPAKAMTRLRLRHAQWLLHHGRLPISAIALETGFADAAHFSRAYKRQFGEPPGQSRRNQPAPPPGGQASMVRRVF